MPLPSPARTSLPSRAAWVGLLLLSACTGEIGDSPGTTTPPPTTPEACVDVERRSVVPMRRLTRDEAQSVLTATFGASTPDLRGVMPEPRGGYAFSTFMDDVTEAEAEAWLDVAAALAEALAPGLRACDDAPLDACARGVVEGWLMCAFRRPPEPDEVARVVAVVVESAADGLPPNEALAVGAMAVVNEPRFLYLVESRDAPSWTLDPYEHAQRLALTLWRAPPDDALLEAAARGPLDAAERTRIARDERAREAFQRFVREWLGVAEETTHAPDVQVALREELRRLIDDAFAAEDGLASLLGARHGWVDAPLEAFYELDAAARRSAGAGDFHRVEIPGRRGLLTHPLVLAAASHGELSSPILRGKLVRTQLLCTPIPTPPPGAVEQEPDLPAGASQRERFEARVAIGPCASCHVLLDPIGFGFEAFDGLGRFRPVDPEELRGEILGGEDAAGEFADLDELIDTLLGSEVVGRCFSRKWLEYALGRESTLSNVCSELDLAAGFTEGSRSVRALFDTFASHPIVVERRAEEVSR